MTQKQTIAAHCLDLVLESGPTTLDDLARAVGSAGLTKARDPRSPTKQALSADPRFVHLHDDVYDATARLLEGSWFTTRIRYRQPGRRQLFVDRELGPLLPLVLRGGLTLLDGGEVRYSERGPAPGLVGPPGWLPDVESGELLGLQMQSARLAVEPVAVDDDAVAGEVTRLRELVTRHAHTVSGLHLYRRAGEDLGSVILSALFEAPDLLRTPLPPLDEILRLPHGAGPADWSNRLLSMDDVGATVQLAGVPQGLLTELQERAARMGVTMSEYVVLQLAADAWRWQPPCVHDLERQRAESAIARREREMSYVDAYDPGPDPDEDIIWR